MFSEKFYNLCDGAAKQLLVLDENLALKAVFVDGKEQSVCL